MPRRAGADVPDVRRPERRRDRLHAEEQHVRVRGDGVGAVGGPGPGADGKKVQGEHGTEDEAQGPDGGEGGQGSTGEGNDEGEHVLGLTFLLLSTSVTALFSSSYYSTYDICGH